MYNFVVGKDTVHKTSTLLNFTVVEVNSDLETKCLRAVANVIAGSSNDQGTNVFYICFIVVWLI